MKITYSDYEDRILGGWIGKSLGGALGARFEGCKCWIDLGMDEIIPDTLPPNDDLDLQVLWLKVLEQKGASLTSDDLADAWIEGCWYPFNEYGNFRRNYRLGLKPPYTGMHNNEFFESGMGCPIRSEIWGYVFPGAPDLAAKYAYMDGTLDHTDESVCSEQMLSAMAADAFFISDLRRLTELHMHYLKPDLIVRKLIEAAFASYDEGLPLKEARERLHVLRGHPEPCDAVLNVPFTFLAMLYGENDLAKTILCALQCGYDTDCTLATAGAFIGQILGAKKIPAKLRNIIGDELVMGIEYTRPEMTLSALARDTAAMGVKLAQGLNTGIEIAKAPKTKPLPLAHCRDALRLQVDYPGAMAAAPGESMEVELTLRGTAGHKLEGATKLTLTCPKGWTASPKDAALQLYPGVEPSATFTLTAPTASRTWDMGHQFKAQLKQGSKVICEETLGVCGSMLWKFMGVYFDPCKPDDPNGEITREQLLSLRGKFGRRYYVAMDREYINEAKPDVDGLFAYYSRVLGKPAVVKCPDIRIDVSQITGCCGEYAVYLAGELHCPDEREVHFWIGNNDAYRFWLNGTLLRETDVQQAWVPGGPGIVGTLRKGRNKLMLKLLKRGDKINFSFGVRQMKPTKDWPRRNDWCTDLAWGNPLAK